MENTKLDYIVMVDAGYGHKEPVSFSAEPQEALAKAYELWADAEENENSIRDDDPQEYVERCGPPEVFVVSAIGSDLALFSKTFKEAQDNI